jgi:hypothetical protein
VIHQIPSLRILDNKEIDTDERIKVEKYVKSLNAPIQSRSAARQAPKKPVVKQGLSVGEKFLATEIRKIKNEMGQTIEEEKLAFAWDTFHKAPVPLATRA